MKSAHALSSLVGLLLLVACGGGSGGSTPGTTSSPSSIFASSPPVPVFGVTTKIPGFDLGPFVLAGQDPNTGSDVPLAQLQYLISDAAQYAVWIRTFGTSGNLQQAGQYIHQAGAKAIIGAYLGNPSGAGAQSNQAELNRLITIANAGHADIVAVGNETLLTGSLSETQLLNYIAYVKASVPASVKVTTVETWNILVDHPNVIAAVDVVLANIYPFYENATAATALSTLQSDYAQIVGASGTKQVIVAETGWPSSGSAPQSAPAAIPSAANQLAYFLAVEQWAKQNNIVLLWFEAVSEPWKANYNDYPSWGIFDATYSTPPVFASAFQ